MNLLPWWSSTFILSFTLLLTTLQATTFTFVNRCNYTVWPGISVDSGMPTLNTTGFELLKDLSRSFQFPTEWHGKLWARTNCKLNQTGSLSCQTGDCGTGLVECNGSGPYKPVTLAEFFLTDKENNYLVSLKYGFNVPMNVEAVRGSGWCRSSGCNVDLNQLCPDELASKYGEGCMEPCDALGTREYCCDKNKLANICWGNVYTEMFRDACPTSQITDYSHDPMETSMFACKGGDFVVTFCPYSSSSSYSS